MEEIGIEPHSFMGKLKDIGRERIEKHFLIFTFCFGMGVISYSAICHIFGLWFVEYVSLMENIGAAFIIPPLLIGLQKAVSKVIRPRSPLEEYLGMMKSELRMLGISLHDVHKRSKDFDAYLKKIYEKESKDRLTFKFLLLDPDSPFREQREKEEGKKIGNLRKEIKKTKDQLERIRSATSSNEKVYFKYYTYPLQIDW